jgi:hypothetical protein
MGMRQAGIRQSASDWPLRRISILLTIVALLLWSYSILQARFDIGFFGLISSFPSSYFIALGILTIASATLWISREDEGKLLFLQLCILLVSLWLAPVIVGGGNPVMQESYADLGRMDYIIRQGHIAPSILWDQAWPLGWIYWAIGAKLSGIGTDGLAKALPWIPFVWQVVLFLPIFVFFRNTIGKLRANCCWAATWVFYVGSWSTELDTGSHVFGIFFAFSMLAIMTMTPALKRRAMEPGRRIVTIILFVGAATSHLLGSLVSLGITTALCASRRVKPSTLAIFFAVLIAAWSIFGATDYFSTNTARAAKGLFRFQVVTETTVGQTQAGNPSHTAVVQVRMITAVLFGAIAVAGGLLSWKQRHDAHTDITVAAIAVGCSFFMLILGTVYGTTLFQRILLFLMPAIAYFAVKLLHTRITAALLGVVMLLALPLSFISTYGNQAADYISPAYLTGANFFQDHTDHGFVTGALPIGRMKYQEAYTFKVYDTGLKWHDHRLFSLGSFPHYICVSSNERADYTFLWNDPDFVDELKSQLEVTTNCNAVYANPDMTLYVSERD